MGGDGHGHGQHSGHHSGQHSEEEHVPDVLMTAGDPDVRYIYRPGHVVVAESDLKLAWKELTFHRAEEVSTDERLGIRVFQVADEVVPEIVRRVRSSGTGRVSPNVVLTLGWHFCSRTPRPIKTPEHLPTELPPFQGQNPVRVALVDTGVADLDWFGERLEKREGKDDEVLQLDDDGKAIHGFGHGTFAASQIVRHAVQAKIVVRRAVKSHGVIDDLTLARALLELGDLQGDAKVDLINLSMSGYTPGDGGLLATGEALRQLFQWNPDLVVVVAAGNRASDRPSYPGAYKRTIAVGAVDGQGRPAYFTNFGHFVDACAHGVDVEGAFPKETDIVWAHTGEKVDYNSGFVLSDGSSVAAAQVAGLLAKRMADGDVTGRQAVVELIENGHERVPGLGTWVR